MKKIIIYAGSLRPGGGMSVLIQTLEALVSKYEIELYTGAKDTSNALKSFIEMHQTIREVKFFHNINSKYRYLISKVYFLNPLVTRNIKFIFTFNYYIPSFSKVITYHINLLTFIEGERGSIFNKVKKNDAKIATSMSFVNYFESRYLLDSAQKINKKIRNPYVLYIGISSDYTELDLDANKINPESIGELVCLTSVQPHKDNETVFNTLSLLKKNRPDIKWKLTVAGGQSKEEWSIYNSLLEKLDISSNVHFLGPVNRSKLIRLFKRSLCLISASKIESFSMVSLEAMAASCPVVITNETSMPESIGKHGQLVNAGSVEDFSNAVIRYVEDREYYKFVVNSGYWWTKKFTFTEFEKELTESLDKYVK